MSSLSMSEEQSPKPASLFRDRNFCLLWLGQVISSLGDWALSIAVPVLVYNATHSKAALSLAVVAGSLPVLLFGLFAGTLVDRWDRRRTLIVSDLGRALAVLLLLGFQSTHNIWLFYLVSFLTAAFACFFNPARTSLMTALLPSGQLLRANAATQSSMQIVGLAGPAVGGLLVGFLRPAGIFVFDAATFAVSAACVAFVASPPLKAGAARAGQAVSGVWRETVEGLRFFWTSRPLVSLLGLMSIAILGAGIYNTLEYAFAKDIWHATPQQFGLLMTAFDLGMLAGGLLVAGPLGNVVMSRLMVAGFAILGASSFGLAFAPNLWLGGAALCVMGFGNILIILPTFTLFQTLVANEMMGRVQSTAGLISQMVGIGAAGLAAGLSRLFPLRHLFAGLAGVFVLCALLVQPLLGRKESGADASNPMGDVTLGPAVVDP